MVAPHAELSDQLMRAAFLNVQLWAGSGEAGGDVPSAGWGVAQEGTMLEEALRARLEGLFDFFERVAVERAEQWQVGGADEQPQGTAAGRVAGA